MHPALLGAQAIRILFFNTSLHLEGSQRLSVPLSFDKE